VFISLYSLHLFFVVFIPSTMHVSLATFSSNIPVIFVTLRSTRFEDDSVAKIISSLAVSDIVNGIISGCCAGMAWSLQPGEQVPTWLLRIINSGMYTFGVCSLWHLAAVSVVKCTVIVRPLTHFTIFTDRALRAIICTIRTLSLVIIGSINVGVTEANFNWIIMIANVTRQSRGFAPVFAAINFVVVTIIITTTYIRMFLVVRRQVRSIPTAVIGPPGSTTIFSSSVRSGKNLFVMCAAFCFTSDSSQKRTVIMHSKVLCGKHQVPDVEHTPWCSTRSTCHCH